MHNSCAGPTQSNGSSTFFRSFTHCTSFTWSIAGGGLDRGYSLRIFEECWRLTYKVHACDWFYWCGTWAFVDASESESLFGPCLSISCCSGSGIGGYQQWREPDVNGVTWLHSENGCPDETSQKLQRFEGRYCMHCTFLLVPPVVSVKLSLASCVVCILMIHDASLTLLTYSSCSATKPTRTGRHFTNHALTLWSKDEGMPADQFSLVFGYPAL